MTESALAWARISWTTVLIPRRAPLASLAEVSLGTLTEDVGRCGGGCGLCQPEGPVAECRERSGQAAGHDGQAGQRTT